MNRRLLLVAATICGTIAGVTRMLRNRLDARRVVKAAEDICVDAAYTTDPSTWPGGTYRRDLDSMPPDLAAEILRNIRPEDEQ